MLWKVAMMNEEQAIVERLIHIMILTNALRKVCILCKLYLEATLKNESKQLMPHLSSPEELGHTWEKPNLRTSEFCVIQVQAVQSSLTTW